MKNSILTVAILTASIIFAADDGIVSSNVIGYQQKGFGRDFNYVCPTFIPIEGTTTITLGDIEASDDFYASKIEFLTPDGANDTVTIDGLGTVTKSYKFFFAEDAAANVRGWYLVADEKGQYPQNDVPISLGSAYCVTRDGGEPDAYLTYTGKVYTNNDQSITLSFGRDFNYVGNCTPTTITLGDIEASDDFYASKIEFLTPDGANDTVTIDGLGTVTKSYKFFFAEDAAANVRGWYLVADEKGQYPQNDLKIGAGDAFCVTRDGGEPNCTITLPTAF